MRSRGSVRKTRDVDPNSTPKSENAPETDGKESESEMKRARDNES